METLFGIFVVLLLFFIFKLPETKFARTSRDFDRTYYALNTWLQNHMGYNPARFESSRKLVEAHLASCIEAFAGFHDKPAMEHLAYVKSLLDPDTPEEKIHPFS